MITLTHRVRQAFASPLMGLIFSIGLCALIYWPGLHGGFLFDDFPNIVDNEDVHVTNLDVSSWWRAAMASPSKELKRPLAMVSFAANEYFAGNNPFPMKLTNLCIHLTNGVLLFFMLQELLRCGGQIGTSQSPSGVGDGWMALGVTCAWLMAPINVTSVLYVVQRMECLAQSFVLAGLWGYLRSRRRHIESEANHAPAFASVLGCTTVGFLCKETSALLPLYAFLAECIVLRFCTSNVVARGRLKLFYVLFLLLPALAGAIAIGPHVISPASYAGRPFTLVQRLLTETRIVSAYIGWTLLPLPGALSFYHDDIPLSNSFLDPPTTLACASLLAALLLAAFLQRRRRPLISLGLLWFFAAHALTGTVLPLELVFEHRNYFPSIGLFLACAGLVVALPPMLWLVRFTASVGVITLLIFTTALRVHDWSFPLNLAYAEALQHPRSARAQYELGRLLVIASGYHADSPFTPKAIQALETARAIPTSSTLPEAGLLLLANHTGLPTNPAWWTSMADKLNARPPSAEDVSALSSLLKCQLKRECVPTPQELLTLFLAAMSHPMHPSRLLGIYSDFAAEMIGDRELAKRLLRDAIVQSPDEPAYREALQQLIRSPSSAASIVDHKLTTYSGSVKSPPSARQ